MDEMEKYRLLAVILSLPVRETDSTVFRSLLSFRILGLREIAAWT